jgi:hypothetical protein
VEVILKYFLGTFVPFDTVNNLAGPSTNGFSAGIHSDGRQAYVGYGTISECCKFFFGLKYRK